MTSALYGRHGISRCVARDYGSLGCKSDVISAVDALCSGQQTCEFEVDDDNFVSYKPCPKDFKSHLRISYVCVKGTYTIYLIYYVCESCTFCHLHIYRGLQNLYVIVEENNSESVTIVRRQRFEGGFHIRKKYSKKMSGVSLPKVWAKSTRWPPTK